MEPITKTNSIFAVSVNVVCDELQFFPDPVTITQKNSLITFNLLTPGYIFPTDGSALVVNDEDDEFPIAWYISPVVIGLADYNNNIADYSYTMSVQNIQTGARVSKDPTIINEE